MSFFNFGKLGRMLLLTAVVAVGLLSVGCGGDDGNPANNTGGNNTGGNNNSGGDNSGGGSSETVSLGGLKWMTKNLNVETADSWCYNNSSDSCAKYGRLYTWLAATAVCQLVGMRLPTNAEWDALVTAAGGASTAGKKLKSKSGWKGNGNGTDIYGFSALPGGDRYSDGGFGGAGYSGNWWTATEYSSGSNYAYYRYMSCLNDNVSEGYDKDDGFSVRCVKDE